MAIGWGCMMRACRTYILTVGRHYPAVCYAWQASFSSTATSPYMLRGQPTPSRSDHVSCQARNPIQVALRLTTISCMNAEGYDH